MTEIAIMTRAGFLIVVILLVAALEGRGQDGATDLEDVTIEIVKEREISLPPATRNFEKVPPRPADDSRPSFSYDFQPFNFQAGQINPAIRPLRLKQENPRNVFGGYLSAGYGNYSSPYLEGFVNTRRDRNKLIGAHAHLKNSGKGPVDDKNSASGSSGLSIYGKGFTDFISLSGEASFEHRFTHFYGYPPGTEVKAADIRQKYNTFSLKGELSNTKNSAFSWQLGAGLTHLADHYEARETEAAFSFYSSYELSDESGIAVNADYAIINRKDSLLGASPRSLLTINPRYEFFPVEFLKLSAGIVAVFENDSIGSKDVHAYPDLRASYPLSPSVDVTAALTGGIEKVSLRTLSGENMWLGANIPIYHTNKLLDLQAAVHAKIGNKVSFNGGFSLAALKHLYFFRNMEEDPSRFTVEYDDVTNRTNIFASIGFAQTEAFKFLMRADLFGYNTDIPVPWHLPTYKLTGEASMNISRKFLLDVGLIMQGGMKAFDPVTDSQVKLDPAFDFNVRAEYLISRSFSVFGQFNNIASNEYPLFLNYPVRGFQALGGLTWSF